MPTLTESQKVALIAERIGSWARKGVPCAEIVDRLGERKQDEVDFALYVFGAEGSRTAIYRLGEMFCLGLKPRQALALLNARPVNLSDYSPEDAAVAHECHALMVEAIYRLYGKFKGSVRGLN